LKRIESFEFAFSSSSSSLQSVEISRNVQFIDHYTFEDTELQSISIEAGSDIFHIEHEFLIDIVHHKLIRNFSVSSYIKIPQIIEILSSLCFSYCRRLSSISFKSNSGLEWIEARALNGTSIRSVVISSIVCFIAANAFHSQFREAEILTWSIGRYQAAFIDGEGDSGSRRNNIHSRK
jgi:hypothetical protein